MKIKLKELLLEKKQLSHEEALDICIQMLKKRWANIDDFDQFFKNKAKEFLDKTKKELKKKGKL